LASLGSAVCNKIRRTIDLLQPVGHLVGAVSKFAGLSPFDVSGKPIANLSGTEADVRRALSGLAPALERSAPDVLPF
jgi:hypothetical protein